MRVSALALVLGAAFGAAVSVINDVSSPYGLLGVHIAHTGWQWVADVLSRLVGVGWAWAGLAIAVGWLARPKGSGAFAAAVTLFAATTAYYCMDSVLRQEPLAMYWHDLRLWWTASIAFGAPLGAVGALIKRPGVMGLLATLTLPVGATVQALLLPTHTFEINSAMNCARIIVWIAAAAVTAVAIARFVTEQRSRRLG